MDITHLKWKKNEKEKPNLYRLNKFIYKIKRVEKVKTRKKSTKIESNAFRRQHSEQSSSLTHTQTYSQINHVQNRRNRTSVVVATAILNN